MGAAVRSEDERYPHSRRRLALTWLLIGLSSPEPTPARLGTIHLGDPAVRRAAIVDDSVSEHVRLHVVGLPGSCRDSELGVRSPNGHFRNRFDRRYQFGLRHRRHEAFSNRGFRQLPPSSLPTTDRWRDKRGHIACFVCLPAELFIMLIRDFRHIYLFTCSV
jgi:hypothetical protein